MLPQACRLMLLVLLSSVMTTSAQPDTPIRKLPFSATRQAGGTLYVSGQIPRTPEGTDVRESMAAETRQAMENLGRALRASGYDFDDVVFVNIYLKDIQDYPEMNAAYASFFDQAFPARACVGGMEIVFGFRIEVSCIAYKAPTKRSGQGSSDTRR